MRISDWSSDVCSSDLLSQLPTAYAANLVPGAAGYPVPFAAAATAGAYPPAPYAAATSFLLSNTGTLANTYNYQGVQLYSDDTEQVSYGVSAAEGGFQEQIGRASCRERGCQSV